MEGSSTSEREEQLVAIRASLETASDALEKAGEHASPVDAELARTIQFLRVQVAGLVKEVMTIAAA